SFDLLAAVAGSGEDDLIDILREVVAAGLLVETEADVFSFRHALTREAVAGQLLGRERRRLHEKALVTLQELGRDDYAGLAHHAEEGAALRHLARVHWERGRSDLQLSMAEAALALAEPGGPSSDLAAANALVAEAHMLAGRHEEAIENADRALALCDQVGCHDIRPRALV